jgi:hypothetical protein
LNWPSYNQSLVRRGEILLDLISLTTENELKEINQGKIDEQPFHYLNTFLLLLSYVKTYLHLPYGQTEGIAQGHAKVKAPSIPYFITINRRINRLGYKVYYTTGGKEFKDNILLSQLIVRE